MRNFKIKRTNSENEDFRNLIDALDKYLAVRNGEANDFFVQHNKVDLIRHVVVVYENNLAVGCGAIKEYESTVIEVKRMFVPAEYRGKGIATTILQEIEKWAMELGYTKCILETGNDMIEAVSLYRKNHFTIIPNYGQYENIVDSLCFSKVLR